MVTHKSPRMAYNKRKKCSFHRHQGVDLIEWGYLNSFLYVWKYTNMEAGFKARVQETPEDLRMQPSVNGAAAAMPESEIECILDIR